MPTYDYRCDHCGHRWDKFQSMSAEPLTTCPNCQHETAKRLIGTGAGIIFKGGGFYETDYRSDSYAKDAKKDTGDTKPDKSDSDKKADKKPETKAEPTKPAEPKPEPKAEKPPTAAKPEPATSKS